MGDLAADTAVEGADGSYTAKLSADWHIWGPCGGYVAAVAMRAVGAYTAFSRPASFTCHFLGVGSYDAVDLSVRTLRRAKRAESVAVTMTQQGRPILEAVAWVIGEVDGIEHHHPAMPEVPKPHELKSIEELVSSDDDFEPHPFWSNFDEKPIEWLEEDAWKKRPGGDPVWRHWIRFRPVPTYEDPFIEAARLLVPLDVCMWPSAARGYAFGELQHIAPSLDLSAVFHALDTGSEWLLMDGYSPVAADGVVGGQSRVWSQDGRLLATGIQSMLCRPQPQPPA